ncbi:MAG: leucine-rich repeat domain-containing protein [Gemella morbillorum]|uniref:leucine-rich repeat domain-containing protein n=3 Tax=Gemella morbillorum TaxID=29391 RepID=UPI00254CB727|nr:leucine-rich repeat domain-containing protein [Gemella morbillorum]MDK8238835.1 leucine-rich repeat domain-containing protein [Gemella morbillorum]
MIKNLFRKKELFSIRKISVGVASVMIGASMLSGVQPLGKMEVQAKDKIEVEATKDVEIKLVEHEGGALIEITATKDISNVDIKITLEGQKVATYHVDKLKAGESITKELTKAQLDKVKESLAKKIKTLPNTAVVRKNVEQTFRLDKSNLKVVVSYDIEEGTIAPNKPDVKPEGPSKPDVKPEGPSNPGKPDTKPEDSANPGTPEVKPENKVVKFEDANLKRILLKKLKAYNGQDEEDDGLAGEYNIKIKDKNYRKDKNDTEIYEKDLEQLESFAIRGFDEETYEPFEGDQQIKSLVGLEKAVNLKQLTISNNWEDSRGSLRDISPLRGLKNLELLRLSHNDIIDISPLAELTNLKHLFISHNQIENVEAVRNLTNLESLDFARNKGPKRISDITPIANLTKLKLLGLSDANIPNISVLKNLVNLETFMSDHSQLGDISALKNAKNLTKLYLDGNKIEDVSALKDLVELKELYLRDNNISKIDFSKLSKLEDVNVQGNKISDYSSLENLKALKYVNVSKQNIDLNKEVELKNGSAEIDMPVLGLKTLAKEGTIKVTSDNDKVSASYNEATNKVTLSVSEEVQKEFANKNLSVNLKVLYVGKGDYKEEETSIDVNNIKLNVKAEDSSNQALRTKLEELVKRELRTEAGYIANQGNQIANNAWINAKTEAEKVLKNDLATKEELEAAIKNLEEKIYEAVLGSEKVKVEKLIRAENRLDLIPKLRKAKTLEAVLELKKLAKPEDETTPEGPNKPEEKPGKPEGTPGGTPGTTPEKPGNDENGNKPLPSAKPVINSYSFDDKVVESAGGEVNVTIKGENLTADNVKIKVLNPFTAAKEEELSNSITYKKVGDDVVATIKLPANTTSTAKSFNLVFTDALGMKAKVTYTEERGENGRVITVLPAGKTKQDSVLSFVTISSYQAHHSTDLTTTTTDKGNVSKKTVAHLYGANLKANITKVKIIDQNGVEWPIHTTGSNIEASDYPMMVIGKLGNGISGNGTYQEAEIVLPNHLDTDMTFTYVFAPDGVNFDEARKVTAVVEKTTNVRPAVKRTITVKYQDENGKTLKDDKVLTGYSWFNYSVEKDTIDGYKNVIVKDNKALSGKFGTKDQEIVLVYTNKEVAQPSETEKPAPQEGTLATSKAKLKELADRDLKLEDSYKKASSELQTSWRKARALANRVLAESNNKEEVDNQIVALEKVIAAIENSTEASKPSEEKPKEEGNAGNTTKPTKSVDELKTELQKLVEQDPTKEDNYKLKDSLQEKAWKTARAKAQALLQDEATAEVLEEQVGKLTRALETLKEENKLANDKADKPNITPESPAQEEKVSEVTSYTGDKAIISKVDGKLLVTVNGKNLKASDLSFRFHDGNSWKDVTLKVISEDSNKIVLEFVVPEELRNSTATYKISAKYKNQTIKANGAINFKIA